METMVHYYNARPSEIGNLGRDVPEARRMHYDTYETTEEREAKERTKAAKKELEALKAELKECLAESEVPCLKVIRLLNEMFVAKYDFDAMSSDVSAELSKRREVARLGSREEIKAYNGLASAYNKIRRQIRYLESNYPQDTIIKLQRLYGSKKSFIEQTGKEFSWKSGKVSSVTTEAIEAAKTKTTAIQFGNGVSDKERAYLITEMNAFLAHWETVFPTVSIKPISWSFGARGKAGSVAYYQAVGRIISVNRNNVGSLIHEIGHYLDKSSHKISSDTIRAYRDSLPSWLDAKSLAYYCKRSEIFARAFEAYCLEIGAGFSAFAQTGDAYLPVLNDELRQLIKETLEHGANLA